MKNISIKWFKSVSVIDNSKVLILSLNYCKLAQKKIKLAQKIDLQVIILLNTL